MSLTIIAAMSKDNVIGKNGRVPWHLPEDLKRFYKLTVGHPVVMERKTYESILEELGRPLPMRINIVLTTQELNDDRITIVHNISQALSVVRELEQQFGDVFVAGGQKVYRNFLPYANKMEITRVYGEWEGDTYFPYVNWKRDWKKIKDGDEHLRFSFETWERR